MKNKFKLTLTLEDGQQVERIIESKTIQQAKKNAWGIKKKSGATRYTVEPLEQDTPKTEVIVELGEKPILEIVKKMSKGKRGRKKLEDKFSKDELKAQVRELLVELFEARKAKDINWQKRVRRSLRRRGWRGGLSLKIEDFDQEFEKFINERFKKETA